MADLGTKIQHALDESRILILGAQVLKMVAEGNSVVRIAARLSLARKTVETYRGRMMLKLGLENLPDLVKFAIKQGVISLE